MGFVVRSEITIFSHMHMSHGKYYFSNQYSEGKKINFAFLFDIYIYHIIYILNIYDI